MGDSKYNPAQTGPVCVDGIASNEPAALTDHRTCGPHQAVRLIRNRVNTIRVLSANSQRASVGSIIQSPCPGSQLRRMQSQSTPAALYGFHPDRSPLVTTTHVTWPRKYHMSGRLGSVWTCLRHLQPWVCPQCLPATISSLPDSCCLLTSDWRHARFSDVEGK